jgi:glycosyltransferase involved in cell wall biosynthesis
MIHSSRQQPCLVITGDGELKYQLRQLGDRLGVRIVFTGFVNQSRMPEVYASADCCVLPSDYGETWGLVINEAMNFDLPVVVSDRVGCSQDLVQEGVTGYRYSFGHPEQLANTLQKLCDETGERRKLGSGARERVQRYSIEVATAGLMEAIDATLVSALST